MKIQFQTTAILNRDQLFIILKEYIERNTDKKLANIYWNESDSGMYCELIFCNEEVESDK